MANDVANDIVEEHSLSSLLLAWFTLEKRDLPWRRTGDPYAIWVSEVMLQQTQVKTVIPYYEQFLQRFPSVVQLATASLEDVLTVWSGLGYYSRARRMWEGARYMCDQRGGKMPQDYDSLLLVPGIGKYTAGAIASIAFGQRVAAIDGNVLRVVSRLLAWPEPVETVRSHRHFGELLGKWQPAVQPGDFNQALMELGAMICTPKNPDCGGCPLAFVCEGYLQDDVFLYPVKKPKSQRQVVTRLTFVLRRGDQVYLQKRPSHGLLADLWEFPGVELSQGNDLKESILNISGDNGFGFFQKTVSERMFDELVREQFERGITLHGPVWYTFSHRRWKIIWAIFDFPDLDNPRNLPELLERPESKPEGVSAPRESVGEYRLDSRKDHQLEDHCWVTLQDLTGLPLPVAFTAIVDDLKTSEE
ncbi:A/G-specific adenine glycosylase [Desulfosporosinus metallidurans]|uniref:Adenine DNA glycosylase n=1 Tax=Desulfosporosinus metallidurans TaxID=1888891 RepID=A0A1Q8QKD3_9FIRM|nr:A/G-specific adenine glycosylase [Desulfosporosinus metallidurans]OLN27811.1 A/G-specific adenine glycosylase [Desulfosporosinus metallidurans]